MTYAKQLCVAVGCSLRTRAMNSCASCSVAAGASEHRKRERFISASCTPSRATVTYWSAFTAPPYGESGMRPFG